MAGVNQAASFSADIENYIADKTLPLARRQLVAYQFGDPLRLPKGRGTTYTATRYLRVPLPQSPLSEGVPPIGETMSIQQVSATAQQWGDKITITDVAELTIKHPLFVKATELTALQIAETLERNTFNTLNSGTQVNYVNSRGSRASLTTGDVLNPHEVNRAYGALFTLGAPRYMGDEMTDTKLEANDGGEKASDSPRKMPHYVSIMHPLVAQDMRENSTVVTAWSYSDINRIYNYEVGEWGGIRFCLSNMVPTWTGIAAGTTPTAATNGNLATGNYTVQVTASDTQNQFESQIYQKSTAVAVTGPNGSLSVVLPVLAGYTFNIYVSAAGSTTLANLGLTTAGPNIGPQAGQAVQLAGGQTVTITGLGAAQTPPAAPGTGFTVYPTYIIGRGAYGQVMLDDARFTYLKEADKSDPLNQLRVIGWKTFYGTLISNQQFFMRIESLSAFSSTFG
jgi:N4-gp56 family major capsid protein